MEWETGHRGKGLDPPGETQHDSEVGALERVGLPDPDPCRVQNSFELGLWSLRLVTNATSRVLLHSATQGRRGGEGEKPPSGHGRARSLWLAALKRLHYSQHPRQVALPHLLPS